MSSPVALDPATTPIKFDPQTYLLSYFNEISVLTQNHKYNYVYALNTTPNHSFVRTLATLYDRAGDNKFVKLKTHQYNSIIPRIRLYRVEYDDDKKIDNQKEFVFNKDTKYTVANMTSPVIRDNSGIKKIDWKLAGTNPVTAENQIEVQIEFYFDSINAFSGGDYGKMIEAYQAGVKLSDSKFNFCDTLKTNTTRNYWSLIFHPKLSKDKGKYDTFNFRIKAFVGWEDIDPNIIDSLFPDKAAPDDLKKLTYGFFLNLTKHQFNFGEDGSITLTANYIASFENSTLNQNFDLLGGLAKKAEELKNTKLGSLNSSTDSAGPVASIVYSDDTGAFDPGSILEAKFNNVVRDSGIGAEVIRNLSHNEIVNAGKLFHFAANNPGKCKSDDRLKQLASASTGSLQTSAEANAKLLELSNSRITEATNVLKGEFYSKFISKVIDNKSGNKYYAYQIDDNSIQKWNNWAAGNGMKPDLGRSQDGENSTVSNALTNLLASVSKTGKNPTETQINELQKSLTETTLKSFEDNTSTPIVFTTLGHIIDTAFNTIAENLGEDVLKNELNRQKIILTNISDEYPIFDIGAATSTSTSTSTIANMAHIPIEMNLLQDFLIEYIVKPQRNSYPLYLFIKDLISTLVLSSLNISNSYNKEINKYSSVSLASALITLGNAAEEDPMKSFLDLDSSKLEASKITTASLSEHYVNFINKDHHKHFYSYYTIYDKYLKDYKPPQYPTESQIITENQKNGIYHFTYAQDYGLIKSINFSRIDTPYLKEAKSVGQKTFYLGQFRDLYNADITMIGNNVFYPGMLLYIKPSVEATIVINKDIPNFSQITGIGGYYIIIAVESTISEEGYETRLKTIWNSDGYNTNSVAEGDECAAMLEEAGLTSPQIDTAVLLAKTLNASSNIKSIESQLEALEADNADADKGFFDTFFYTPTQRMEAIRVYNQEYLPTYNKKKVDLEAQLAAAKTDLETQLAAAKAQK